VKREVAVTAPTPFEKFRQLARAIVKVPRKDIENKRNEPRQSRLTNNTKKKSS